MTKIQNFEELKKMVNAKFVGRLSMGFRNIDIFRLGHIYISDIYDNEKHYGAYFLDDVVRDLALELLEEK